MLKSSVVHHSRTSEGVLCRLRNCVAFKEEESEIEQSTGKLTMCRCMNCNVGLHSWGIFQVIPYNVFHKYIHSYVHM